MVVGAVYVMSGAQELQACEPEARGHCGRRPRSVSTSAGVGLAARLVSIPGRGVQERTRFGVVAMCGL